MHLLPPIPLHSKFPHYTIIPPCTVIGILGNFQPILLFRPVLLLEFQEISPLYYYYNLYNYLEWRSILTNLCKLKWSPPYFTIMADFPILLIVNSAISLQISSLTKFRKVCNNINKRLPILQGQFIVYYIKPYYLKEALSNHIMIYNMPDPSSIDVLTKQYLFREVC